jgi:hypothetical protein
MTKKMLHLVMLLGLVVAALSPTMALDVSANGGGNEKIEFCHVPPGNPAAAHSISTSVNAAINGGHFESVDDYWASGPDNPIGLHGGDYRGSCQNDSEPEPPTPVIVTPVLKAVAPAAVCGESGTAVPVPIDGVVYGEVWYEGSVAKVVATTLDGFTFEGGVTQVTLEVAIQLATECPPELTVVTPPDMVVTPSTVCETRGTAAPVAIEGVEYGEVWYEGDIAKVTATTLDGFIFPDDSHSMVLEANVASTVKCDDVDEPVDPTPVDPMPTPDPVDPTPTPAPVDPTPTPTPVPGDGGDGDGDGGSDGDGGAVDNGGDTDTDVDPAPAPVTPAPTAAPAVDPVTGLPVTGSGPAESSSTWPFFALGALVLLGGGVIGARRQEA